MPKLSFKNLCHKPQSRDKLLAVAIDLFWLEGFASVSVDDICKSAKVHKGSFYHYFSTKSDLAIATLEKLWADNKPYFDQAFSPASPPADRVTAYADLVFRKQSEKMEKYGRVIGCPFSNYGAEMCANNDLARDKMNQMMDFCSRYFETLIRDYAAASGVAIIDASPIAQEMQSYVMGVLTSAKIRNDLDIIRRDLAPGLMRYLTPLTIATTPLSQYTTSPQGHLHA